MATLNTMCDTKHHTWPNLLLRTPYMATLTGMESLLQRVRRGEVRLVVSAGPLVRDFHRWLSVFVTD